MVITTANLVKVSTIKKSHAKQIRFLDVKESLAIRKAIHPETGNLKEAEVLGYIPGSVLYDCGLNVSQINDYYLVQTPKGLRWVSAPTSGEVYDYYQEKSPQLFV